MKNYKNSNFDKNKLCNQDFINKPNETKIKAIFDINQWDNIKLLSG